MPPRPIKYDDLVGTEVEATSQYILCLDCYERGNYDIKESSKEQLMGKNQLL